MIMSCTWEIGHHIVLIYQLDFPLRSKSKQENWGFRVILHDNGVWTLQAKPNPTITSDIGGLNIDHVLKTTTLHPRNRLRYQPPSISPRLSGYQHAGWTR